MIYAQKFGENITAVVVIIKYNDEEVMLQDMKTQDIFVLAWENFHGHYEELYYECDTSNYMGPDIAKLLEEITDGRNR